MKILSHYINANYTIYHVPEISYLVALISRYYRVFRSLSNCRIVRTRVIE